MSLLKVQSLNLSFGGVNAIDALSLTIEPGPIHSIIGPNGAGKTTLFNLITGVYVPSDGQILFEDKEIAGKKPWTLAAMGLARTFQNLQIFFNMTAIDNIMVGMHLNSDTRFLPSLLRLKSIIRGDNENREKSAELLKFVGLGDYIGADTDSMPYGALKRLEIARSLATQPKILLLDEPAAGLNPAETGELDGLIQKIAASGVTVVLVEHDMKLVMGVSDHIIVLESGKLLCEGSADEIRHNPDVIAAYLGESGRNL
ncbi:MAG: ABC transporter ATP-binding protein [Rhodospirillales bacterium]|nr:ABC transporter ATP-binding protein [Rhodospirillales bacterium]